MRLVQIRVQKDEHAECLMRELAAYTPTRVRLNVSIEVGDRSEAELLSVLSALERCVLANDIGSVRLELDGRPYMLAASK
jgi:hypothetical protein